ncbi:MAG TPA: patatin-like phospholipase family protein [Candidatus Acidoferrales bacterium]|nr:patatin-like phospholipase family protein [Candidatus Acidoferrales bacterium]
MPTPTPTRRTFLAGAAALASLPVAVSAQSPDPRDVQRVARALVLSGGGARGAYQAGIIDYLRLARGIRDGRPFAPYQFVAGSSIGALNGYFVATGQYGLLRRLWYTIADQRAIELKAQYAKIIDGNAGIGTRFAAAMRLVLGLKNSDTGVIDGARLRAWLASFIDPSRPVVTPFLFTATNLTNQSPEFFYLVPSTITDREHETAANAIRLTVGPDAVIREASPDILIDALRASAAIPIAFDPVALPAVNGDGFNSYVDGGVTANTPIAAARAAALRLDVVLLDPPLQPTHYHNALEIGFGVFGAMQRRILTGDMLAAYLEHDVDIYQMQPQDELPVGVVGFDDRENLYKTFEIGFEDAARGFKPFQFGAPS